MPASVKKIGYDAFGRCSDLKSVNLGSVEDIGSEAFIWCQNLGGVVIPNSVTNIGGSAFYGCSELSDVTIGSGVAKIGEPTIPHYYDEVYDEWTTVDFDPAFGGCDSLMNFKLADGNATYELIGGCLYYRATPSNAKTLAVYPPGRTEFALSGDVTVTAIGEGACSGCNKLTDLTIPSSVRNIGIEAFAHCGGLASVIIPANSVTNIEFGAFAWDMSVMNVEVAGSVKNIGEWAFMHCFNAGVYSGRVGSLVLHEGIETIGVEAFHRGFCIGEIIIPNSVTSLGEGAFGANRFVRRIVIGSGLDSISDYAFQCDGGSMLSKLEIGPNVTTIGDYAFAGCEKLRVLNIPAGVTEIGDYAFYGCTSLCALNLPSTLTHIGEGAFGGSSYAAARYAVKSTRGLLGVSSLSSSYAYGGCEDVRRVLIPHGVAYIGEGAFGGVTSENLSRVYLPASLKPGSEEGIDAYLASLFPGQDFTASDVMWYDDVGDLNYVTVTYDMNFEDGEKWDEQVLDYLDALPVPSRDGYAFAGWWTSSDDSGEQISLFSPIENDVEFYAHWVETPVTFGGDAPWTAVLDNGRAEWVLQSGDVAFGYTSSASMAVTGPCIVTFAYKNVKNGGEDANELKLIVDGEEVASYGAGYEWTVVDYEQVEAGEHVVTWQYENKNGSFADYARLAGFAVAAAIPHTMTFNLAGGTMVEATTRTVLRSVGKLPHPRKDNSIFGGWWTAADGGDRVNSGDTIESDISLYAHWVDAPFSAGGDKDWFIDEDGSFKSESLVFGEQIYAEVRYTGPCRVSFDWKAATSYWSNNQFEFFVDGVREMCIQANSSGVYSWNSETFDVEGEGEHVIRWVFEYDDESWGSYGGLENCVWLRNVAVGSVRPQETMIRLALSFSISNICCT